MAMSVSYSEPLAIVPNTDEVSGAAKIVADMWSRFHAERERLNRIDWWYRWKQEEIRLPRQATKELKALVELSKTPWLSLVVTTVAQCMYVDGYRSKSDKTPDPLDMEPKGPWRTWLANGMERRQSMIHRATLAYGYSYVTVLPGIDSFMGKKVSVIRGVSPRNMYAEYENPADDDWPEYAIHLKKPYKENEPCIVTLYDDTYVWEFKCTAESAGADLDVEHIELINVEAHGAGVCPIVRYSALMDLEGRCTGEIEPHIAMAQRINKTSYDRMLVQHFASWKVRTIAGLAMPVDEGEDAEVRQAMKLQMSDILISEDPDTKFGVLAETPLTGFISAWNADIDALAAITQTPASQLTGQIINVSAEGLVASRGSLHQKVDERKKSIGHSHAQSLRLASYLEGDIDYAEDVTGRVTWQDTEIRSMAQAVDALGKAALMLEIPHQALWSRIPGVEKQDVDEWKKLAEAEQKEMDSVIASIQRQKRNATGGNANGVAQLGKVPPADTSLGHRYGDPTSR